MTLIKNLSDLGNLTGFHWVVRYFCFSKHS